MEFKHDTVLLHEAVDLLDIKPTGIYVDATLGGAGHSKLIHSRLDKKGTLICFDQDEWAIKNAQVVFKDASNVILIKANFRDLRVKLKELGIEKIDGIVFDLGISSMQIDQEERGFSYRFDGPLDMRMDQSSLITAQEIVNGYPLSQLIKIFDKYGEEKNAKPIARAIVKQREEKEITTTKELNDLILEAIPKKDFYNAKSHPAKRVFQAIRIEVNKELDVFEEALVASYELLNLDGVISVITFHSLEDRICKYYFRQYSQLAEEFSRLPQVPEQYLPKAKLINKKPIVASEQELNDNKRAMSAKLRGLKKFR